MSGRTGCAPRFPCREGEAIGKAGFARSALMALVWRSRHLSSSTSCRSPTASYYRGGHFRRLRAIAPRASKSGRPASSVFQTMARGSSLLSSPGPGHRGSSSCRYGTRPWAGCLRRCTRPGKGRFLASRWTRKAVASISAPAQAPLAAGIANRMPLTREQTPAASDNRHVNGNGWRHRAQAGDSPGIQTGYPRRQRFATSTLPARY